MESTFALGMAVSLCGFWRRNMRLNQLATAANSRRTINFLLDRRPKKVAINAYKEILER